MVLAPSHRCGRLCGLQQRGASAGVRLDRPLQRDRLARRPEPQPGEDFVEGLENAPLAFFGLLEGKNFGKLIVRLAQD